jgi:predicted transcriptional regulator
VKLTEFVQTIPGFTTLSHREKIEIFMWSLHTHRNLERISSGDISRCYSELSLGTTNVTTELNRLEQKGAVLKNKDGYRLEMKLNEALTTKYGQRVATIYVDQLLAGLPDRLGNMSEKSYLEETLICLRHKAFRAAVVMVWNIAYDHICDWTLSPARLFAFNQQMQKTYTKKNLADFKQRDDFENLKEFEVLQVLASSGLINGGMHTILKEKLDRRNKAAHPTGITFFQHTAEEIIRDLIENVVLKLA